MSQEGAELRTVAEAAYAAINSGDLDAFMATVSEDVEFTSLVAEAEGATFRGHDGVRAWWETIRGAFQAAQRRRACRATAAGTGAAPRSSGSSAAAGTGRLRANP